jgi:pilus assembly protein CpaF
MHDETIDFTSAQQAIEALLEQLPDDLEQLTDLHVQGGKASVRARGGVRQVELGSMQLDLAVSNIANLTASAMRREIGPRSPILEQRIPPRYRVTVSYPSILQDGHWAMALRLLAEHTIPLEKWVEDGFLTSADHDRLITIMAEPMTVLVAGTMGSGKTSLLRSMLARMPASQRLVVIEDAAELNIERENSVSLQTSHAADLTALIAHAFRSDAERVVVGEIRDVAAMQFLTLAAGGTRALTTIHTEPTVGALVRLHQMVLQSGYHVTIEQIRQAIHVVVTVKRMPDGSRPVSLLDDF